MMKTVAAIILVGVAVGFSGVLNGVDGGAPATTAATTAATAVTTGASATSDAHGATPAATPEVCGRLLAEFTDGHIGDPDARAQAMGDAAINAGRQVAYTQRLEAAGCTAEYMNANGEAILTVVNRGRSSSQLVR